MTTKKPQWTPGKKVAIKKHVWDGPESSSPQGGITFSMLSKYLTCKERFRVRYLEGLSPVESFNAKIEYGQMWHECEEAIASEVAHFGEYVGTTLWNEKLFEYVKQLGQKYRQDQAEILKWYEICKLQFQVYVKYWNQHKEYVRRQRLLAEYVFHVPYTIHGVTVYLRGKFDSVDMIERDGKKLIILQENKTKGDVDVEALKKQLKMDFQSMLYLVALSELHCDELWQPIREMFPGKGRKPIKIGGIRYNVVKRPLSGGRHSIRKHQATKSKAEESDSEYYARLKGLIESDPGYFFNRFDVEVSQTDIELFKEKVLNPILLNLVLWYRHTTKQPVTKKDIDLYPLSIHWRHPYGVDNSVDNYGIDFVDNYLDTGSTVGLTQGTRLFRELQPPESK